MTKSNSFEELLSDYSDEPCFIHCQCCKCGKQIILPEKVWLKRGSICNYCHHQYRIHEEE